LGMRQPAVIGNRIYLSGATTLLAWHHPCHNEQISPRTQTANPNHNKTQKPSVR
jgi:hypothetical protein